MRWLADKNTKHEQTVRGNYRSTDLENETFVQSSDFPKANPEAGSAHDSVDGDSATASVGFAGSY